MYDAYIQTRCKHHVYVSSMSLSCTAAMAAWRREQVIHMAQEPYGWCC